MACRVVKHTKTLDGKLSVQFSRKFNVILARATPVIYIWTSKMVFFLRFATLCSVCSLLRAHGSLRNPTALACKRERLRPCPYVLPVRWYAGLPAMRADPAWLPVV